MRKKKGNRALVSRFMNKIAKPKRSQEEMVGFALIIILVAVIVLVFLAISIRKPVRLEESKEVGNFLHSSLLLTTECKLSAERAYDLKDLITACYNKEECLNERDSCSILDETLIGLAESGFKSGGVYKGYVFEINDNRNETLFYLKKGNETSLKEASEAYFYNHQLDGNVYVKLTLFY